MPTKQKITKKVAKKARKQTVKKSGKTKKMALVCASPDQCFWTTDGRILSNLVELRDLLSSVADEVFEYHVNNDKNDFAEWVGNVLQDQALAKSLRKAKKSKAAHTVVVKRLRIYEL